MKIEDVERLVLKEYAITDLISTPPFGINPAAIGSKNS